MNTWGRMLCTASVLSCLLAGSGFVHADDSCKRLTMDYSRHCGDVVNLQALYKLKVNECAMADVSARSVWNASGLLLEKGGVYRFEVASDDYWCDKNIRSNANGWEVKDETLKDCFTGEPLEPISVIREWIVRAYEWWRRQPGSKWFELIGISACGSGKSEFPIGLGKEFEAAATGEFCAYANDLNAFYFNNSGSIAVAIRRIK